MIQNETIFSAITDAVEKTVHTESNADFRLGLTYGSEADYLYNQSTGNAPAINFFFAEDADIINLSAENRAKIYYLDITDEGSNYNSIFTLFNGCEVQKLRCNIVSETDWIVNSPPKQVFIQ